MSIEVQLKQIGAAIQLVANTEGWGVKQTEYDFNPYIFVTGNPDVVSQKPTQLLDQLKLAWRTTKEQRPTDFNGLKISVSCVSVTDEILRTEGHLTDYFTLWGIPRALPDLFKRHSEEVVINHASPPDASYRTFIPWGLATHNILLDENGDVLAMVIGQGQGFHAGRVSITETEQMDPDTDSDPFNTAYRSYWEELGILVPPSTQRLLGVAVEIREAYPSYCFIANTNLVVAKIVDSWTEAKDYKENAALFSVPMSRIDEWLKDEITSETWHEFYLAGQIAPDTVLTLHPTVPWRISLLKKYTKSS